jgi:hypothetical protein
MPSLIMVWVGSYRTQTKSFSKCAAGTLIHTFFSVFISSYVSVHTPGTYMVTLMTTSQCIVAVPEGSCNTPYFETFSKGVHEKTTDFKHKEGVL